jgi:hypothetical protein
VNLLDFVGDIKAPGGVFVFLGFRVYDVLGGQFGKFEGFAADGCLCFRVRFELAFTELVILEAWRFTALLPPESLATWGKPSSWLFWQRQIASVALEIRLRTQILSSGQFYSSKTSPT